MNGQAKNRTKLRFAQSVKVRISTRIGRKAGYKNGECRIYSFAFNGGIIRLCVFVHHDPGALDLLHDGWEGTGLGQAWRGLEWQGNQPPKQDRIMNERKRNAAEAGQ